MKKFLVVKLLESSGVVLPTTTIYGSVEIRSHKSDSEQEICLFKNSASNFDLDYEKYQICARIATIVNSESVEGAIALADDLFSQVLDIKYVEYAISNFKTSDIGFVKNLDSGDAEPIVSNGFRPTTAFIVHQGDIQRYDETNYILSLNNELSQRYIRSLHWSRNSRHEKNDQLRILYYWFSLEALLKETEADNIIGIVRWFLGFPNGKNSQDISPLLIKQLRSHSRYDFWSKEIFSKIDEIRIFRNDSVHSGFRSVDFTKKNLKLYNKLMILGCSRCQSAVKHALLNNLSSISEFKNYISAIFESNGNLVNDVHHTVIHLLDEL
ncbi:hypothetical protein IQ22_04080 [Pseudomonas duriflava]|uniref:Uncharacterized protein n=1 Tax=Pseudomonas duriflava TaxID=459528 RepID=A0A562PX04_9PSED|nr:HEPN domain-containing protein [Pseudomonas duriflava]TWI48947.1 hypothetical protein IQ22_04080 [Pseudomonas duriflava]